MGKRCLSNASAKRCLFCLPSRQSRGSLVNQTPEVNRRHHLTRMLEPAMGPSPWAVLGLTCCAILCLGVISTDWQGFTLGSKECEPPKIELQGIRFLSAADQFSGIDPTEVWHSSGVDFKKRVNYPGLNFGVFFEKKAELFWTILCCKIGRSETWSSEVKNFKFEGLKLEVEVVA